MNSTGERRLITDGMRNFLVYDSDENDTPKAMQALGGAPASTVPDEWMKDLTREKCLTGSALVTRTR